MKRDGTGRETWRESNTVKRIDRMMGAGEGGLADEDRDDQDLEEGLLSNFELTIQLNTDSSTINRITLPDCLTRGVRIAISRKCGTTSSRSTIHIRARSRRPPK